VNAPRPSSLAGLIVRSHAGGLFMGLANLVPGISGGTMLVATGIYTRFVEAVAEVTTLKFRARSLLVLALVGATALLAILLLAGTVKGLVEEQRWIMYSLFIGLTLGGVPIVWRMARPASSALFAGAAAGVAVMAVTTFVHVQGEGSDGAVFLFIGGVAGASAMILPGISGAYLLLVLGQYQTILGAVDQLKHGEAAAAAHVLVPVGLGMAAGIAGVSNLIRWTLHRYEQATLGVLLGLLFGSVLGLWPFQTGDRHAPVSYAPSAGQAAAALGLVAAGLATTLLIDRLGRRVS